MADECPFVGRQPLDDLTQSLQRRTAAELGDQYAVRAGDDVWVADRPATLRHDRDTAHPGQAHADDAGGEHVVIAEQPGVAPPAPAAHHAAHDGGARQVGVGVLDEQVRRECVRVRQQQMQIPGGAVEPITGDQGTRAGTDKVQLECLGGQAGRQPHHHRGLVLDLVAAGDDGLGDATDKRGRIDHLQHRAQDVGSPVGVCTRSKQHRQRRRLTRQLVARLARSLHRGLPRVGRGANPDSDPHSSMMRRCAPGVGGSSDRWRRPRLSVVGRRAAASSKDKAHRPFRVRNVA